MEGKHQDVNDVPGLCLSAGATKRQDETRNQRALRGMYRSDLPGHTVPMAEIVALFQLMEPR